MPAPDYMALAYELAIKGRGRTSPNPMVGAVVVKNGRMVGQGWHHYCGGPHAEVLALRQAGHQARGATLYVTLEPCSHYGRTPPCVNAVIKAGIREVVIGMHDPNPLTNGRSITMLRQKGIRVRCGFMAKELGELNEAFVKYITRRQPFVVAKTAQTLDGKVATEHGSSKWITSPATRKFSRRLRNDFDAIMVGVDTVLQDDPCLCAARKTKRLWKIIVDSRLRVPLTAKVLKNSPRDCVIVTTRRAALAKVRMLRKRGADVLIGPTKGGRVDLRWLMRELAKKEMAAVLLEGGPTLIGAALKQRLIDKWHIYLAPKIMGDEKGHSSVKGLRCAKIDDCVSMDISNIRKVGKDLFLEAYPKYL